MFKKIFFIFYAGLLSLVLALPAVASPSPKVEQVIATVTSVTPGAWVERLGKKMPVEKGMKLQRIDALSTDAKGRVEVVFTEKTTMALGPETRVSLESFDLRPRQPDLHIRMATGTARVVSGGITKLSANALKVFTPMATIGIRGTDCAMTATPDKTVLVLNSIGERDIEVTNMLTLEETLLNKPGQAIVVTAQGNAPREATAQERKSGLPVL